MNIVFPTFEIAPITNGGVGQYTLSLIQALHNTQYQPIIILYDVAYEASVRARQYFYLLGLKCEIFHVNDLSHIRIESKDIWDLEKKSLALKTALEKLISNRKIAGIEWCDYAGVGFHSLRDKHCNPQSVFKKIPMWIHLHGIREIWDLTERYPVSLDSGDGYVFSNYAERLCLELADAWKSSSQAVAEWYSSYFGIHNQVFVSPLPYRKLAQQDSHSQFAPSQLPLKILCPGRIQYLKGIDIVVRAGVELCKTFPNKFHITFAGYDTPTAKHEYSSSLEEFRSLIPEEFASHFSFPGKFSGEQYLQNAQESHLAIFASRIETFCLAAHELNWIGIPLILSDIPAFKEHFVHGVNCYKFNHCFQELALLLEKIIREPELLSKISSQPIADFNPDIFQEIVRLTPTSKVNSNYTLFSRILEIKIENQPSHSADINHTILSLQDRIKAMETSKFWKLRKQWFKVKRKLKLTDEEP